MGKPTAVFLSGAQEVFDLLGTPFPVRAAFVKMAQGDDYRWLGAGAGILGGGLLGAMVDPFEDRVLSGLAGAAGGGLLGYHLGKPTEVAVAPEPPKTPEPPDESYTGAVDLDQMPNAATKQVLVDFFNNEKSAKSIAEQLAYTPGLSEDDLKVLMLAFKKVNQGKLQDLEEAIYYTLRENEPTYWDVAKDNYYGLSGGIIGKKWKSKLTPQFRSFFKVTKTR